MLDGQTGRETLAGLKVVEFGHVIAGPIAGTLLADLGAEVVHVEDPGAGDPARTMGPAKDGVHLWWKVAGRNKRSVTINLREERGQELGRRLVDWADVVITNMRFDTLRGWGLDWETLHARHPRLVMLQISGFGASTTERNAPGFGKVGEARSGIVHLTGFPDGPPVHTGFSHADSVTGLMGAFAIQAALYRRATDPDFAGEWIDIALFEPLFRLIEWQIILHDQLGIVPGRAGNQLAVAPGAVVNTFLSEDGHWITVTSGTPRSVRQIGAMVGVPEDELATVADQALNKERLDGLLREYIGSRPAQESLDEMTRAGVVASRIFTTADILADDIYRQRGDIITVDDPELGPVRMQGVVPRMTNHPGAVWRSAPSLGMDNELVYREHLGVGRDEYAGLIADGVI